MSEMDFICPLNAQKVSEINAMLSSRPIYNIVQENGQRLYGPPIDKSLTLPERGSEVFVGRLPRDCYEDELVPMFEKIGVIYQMRLMMDFSGTNRGFAFVKYTNPSDAKKAAECLDGSEVRSGNAIGVQASWDNRRLFIGGIPRNKNKRQIMAEMKRVTEGVTEVIVYMSVYNSKNRGFAFIEYETHYKAAMARRRMAPGFKLWNNHEIRVDWADPEPELDEEIMSQVKILHVRNLLPNISETDLKELFTFDKLHVERVKKIRDFAFIHYERREDAEIALQFIQSKSFQLNNPSYKQMQASWARPQKSVKLNNSKRTSSMASTPDATNAQSNQLPQSLNLPQTSIDYQMQCYQNNAIIHNNSMAMSSVVPVKYECINEDKNSSVYIVWVPILWMSNHNKDLPLIENTYNLFN